MPDHDGTRTVKITRVSEVQLLRRLAGGPVFASLYRLQSQIAFSEFGH
jgi:hypothetical protein